MLRVASVAVIALALVPGCSSDAGTEVAMTSGRRFAPETITVGAGDTVTWVSESDDAHTVTAYQQSFAEGTSYFSSGDFDTEEEARDQVAAALIPPGGSYEVTLEEPGTYEYFCIPHEDAGMKGTIVVEG